MKKIWLRSTEYLDMLRTGKYQNQSVKWNGRNYCVMIKGEVCILLERTFK